MELYLPSSSSINAEAAVKWFTDLAWGVKDGCASMETALVGVMMRGFGTIFTFLVGDSNGPAVGEVLGAL